MATVDLGSIRFNWKGAYAGGTAYVVDDVVSVGGASYICKLATTGNTPPNATYWDVMSSAGTNGTDGTDLGTVITTEGDIAYRDGSGLQRLAKGTAAQVLTVNSGATAPEWAAAGGGLYESIAVIADHKAYNVQGGAFNNHAWRTRDFNTEVSDVDGIVSISSNQFILQAGTYTIRWEVEAYGCGSHQSRCYNITDSTTVAWGPCGTDYGSTSSWSGSFGVTTIAAQKTFEIQHRCDTSYSAGFGVGVVTGMTQTTYAVCTIWKHS